MERTEAADGMSRTLWVDWGRKIVSFHPVEGFEPIDFESLDAKMSMTLILATRVFRFQ